MAKTRQDFCDSIASQIADYRAGEIPRRTRADVESWVCQFDEAAQESILREMDHVLARSYFSRAACEEAMKVLVRDVPNAGVDPAAFWSTANFLWIQRKGDSQRHMRSLLGPALRTQMGVSLDSCGKPGGTFVYLDDCVFTATHVRHDLVQWVKSPAAPPTASVLVVAVVVHTGRVAYTGRVIEEAARAVNKRIKIVNWSSALQIADAEWDGSETSVLKPKSCPPVEPDVERLMKQLVADGHPFQPRRGETSKRNAVFSTEAARDLLEQEFLKAGARIKYQLCPSLKANHWPLGYDVFKCVGFGSLVVTYRNCPNNCPLALWAGGPWRPLFPRRVNPAFQNAVPEESEDDFAVW